MALNSQPLSSEAIQMIVSSLTHGGAAQLSEIEVERFLNALTRAQSNVPTGVPSILAPKDPQ